jgi:LAS superfamily LD-carboxypeptidase LdcB
VIKIVRLTESKLVSIIKKIILEQDDIENPILNKYLKSKQELIPLYQEIERVLDDKFTEKHFTDEIKYSGGLKELSVGILSSTIENFNKLKKEVPGIRYGKKSYRSYELQKDVFLKYAKKRGGTISGGLYQAALPGFSQHHTGKALDILSGVSGLTSKILQKHNFILPYPKKTSFRMAEPWHIYFDS